MKQDDAPSRTLDYASPPGPLAAPAPISGCLAAFISLLVICLILGGAPVTAVGLMLFLGGLFTASPPALIFGSVFTLSGGAAMFLAWLLGRRFPKA